ncbi:SOS response-associated peptidase [Saccharopolyspora sp. HNM0983]|uniref:Abasic site processing protein n=1 Tax=Saccharopolyspora montiporae TaxID=2781240 RepID=A0A929BDZ1_9PSEU|nr:SOS response-associated peptidase [Saccharopolyspora sp. HNM0983]MBE9375843.1 SOS response-associated peptidase [Saccharopolyspora sp. HNM0983]
MCGRYASGKTPAELAAEFAAVDRTGGAAPGPDFNIAPTKDVPGVIAGRADQERGERQLRVLRWGLVPKWAERASSRMINAKAETVIAKPAFRAPIKYHRCLLPADGWYEWKREAGGKQPIFTTGPDSGALALAGLFATWRDPAEPQSEPLVSCAVLTTAAFGALADVHHRMPLLLPDRSWQRWLDPEVHEVGDLLEPDPQLYAGLRSRPVSSAVNKVANNGPGLVEEVRPDEPSPVRLDRS